MALRTLLTDDDAVSPVIGVILMVAITTILAALAGVAFGAFAGEVNEQAPTVEFDYDFTNNDSTAEDRLEMTLETGTITRDKNIYIVSDMPYEDDKYTGGGNAFECDVEYVCPLDFDDEQTVPGDTMEAGERYIIFALNPSTEFEKAHVDLVWRNAEGTRSTVLDSWSGPATDD